MKNRTIIYFTCSFFAGGVVFLYLQDIRWFVYGNDISLFDVFELCITSAIGIYIASSLQTNLESRRYEKDIIFSRIDYIDNSLDALLSEIMSNPTVSVFRLNGTVGSCRKIWSKVSQLFRDRYAKEYNLETLMCFAKKLQNEMILVSKLSTGMEISGNQETNIMVKDNLCTYSEKRRNEILSEMSNIKNLITDIKLEINRL